MRLCSSDIHFLYFFLFINKSVNGVSTPSLVTFRRWVAFRRRSVGPLRPKLSLDFADKYHCFSFVGPDILVSKKVCLGYLNLMIRGENLGIPHALLLLISSSFLLLEKVILDLSIHMRIQDAIRVKFRFHIVLV